MPRRSTKCFDFTVNISHYCDFNFLMIHGKRNDGRVTVTYIANEVNSVASTQRAAKDLDFPGECSAYCLSAGLSRPRDLMKCSFKTNSITN